VGTTASSGNFTISADEDYAIRPSAGQSAWDGDAQTLPKIDFSGGSYYMENGCGYHYIMYKNIELVGGSTDNGAIWIEGARRKELWGCLISTSVNYPAVRTSREAVIRRCIISGSGTGSNQVGVFNLAGRTYLIDCAIYGMGGYGIQLQNDMVLRNVNIGVEVANGSYDIAFLYACAGYQERIGFDVKLGGTNGYFTKAYTGIPSTFYIENYQKTLGRHYSFTPTGELNKVTAGAGTPVPDQRTSGSTTLLEVLPNGPQAGMQHTSSLLATPLFEHEFEATTDSKTYRYYVQTNISGGLTASEIFIEAEFIDQYDSTSEYHVTTLKSDEAVSIRSGITDWSRYVEVTVQPAAASKVRIRAYLNKYDSTNKVWIDPKVVIS
jgi:hypothetical protein